MHLTIGKAIGGLLALAALALIIFFGWFNNNTVHHASCWAKPGIIAYVGTGGTADHGKVKAVYTVTGTRHGKSKVKDSNVCDKK